MDAADARRALSVALAAVALAACAPAAADPVLPPPDHGGFDYQLGGASDTAGLAVVARDSSDQPLPGAYNICYVNGFQTQPGDAADWVAHRAQALLRDGSGRPVSDPDWPDEYVLDPSTAAQRAVILEAMTPVITGCADRGFDAVEFDNLDTFTRFPAIAKTGAFELAREYLAVAHDHGLAAGQKNAAAHTAELRGLGFDFAVAEECAAYAECGSYTGVYGRHVLQIEYAPESFAEACAAPGRAPLTILRDRDLVPPGAPGHVYRQCP